MQSISDVNSPAIIIEPSSVTVNGTSLTKGGPVAEFHSLLGEPNRIEGKPAPVGHRSNQIHFYDELGLLLNEHHYTYQIGAITLILNVAEAICPTTNAFHGELVIGGVNVRAGDVERDLAGTTIPFHSVLAGSWSAEVLSAQKDGRPIRIYIDTKGAKLPSGRRSKRREIISVAICLEQDPWDTTCRPN